METLPVETFLQQAREYPVLDVRTPAEYLHGHIPGAVNLPLFSNEERSVVGTLYKQKGRERALLEGLDLVGPRMRSIVEQALRIQHECSDPGISSSPLVPLETPLLVHCWRGGMRSGSIAWLLRLYGFRIRTLEGGYKRFRNHILETFEKPRSYVILGGKTGSGKTKIIAALRAAGEQVVDLEKLANHQGSAFGHLGKGTQPTEEHFQNRLGFQLDNLDDRRRIWLEDESRTIGRIALPLPLWNSMEKAPLFTIRVPHASRVRSLVEEYGSFPVPLLLEQVRKLQKRLGGVRTKAVMEALERNDLEAACETLLLYYDRAYQYGIDQREDSRVRTIETDETSPEHLAQMLIESARVAGY